MAWRISAGRFYNPTQLQADFPRTAVNDQAGAKTGMSSLISALLIVLTLLFLTPLFYYLPNAILASVIMVAVFGLIDVKEAVHLWHADRSDFWMLVVTFVATLGLGIEQGVGVGVILSLAWVIFRSTRPHVAELGKVPGTHFYRNVERFENVEGRQDLLILRFDSSLYFANTNYFKDQIHEMADRKGDSLLAIIVNSDSINSLDSSGAHALDELLEEYHGKGVKIIFTGVKGPVRDMLSRAHITEKIGQECFFMSVQEAVDYFDKKNKKEEVPFSDYTLQVNDG